ncbi:MAG: hypothetical protein WC604_02435 [Candidatus Gracilibacteria bacterium]
MTDPKCPYFGRCGGCSAQHIDYAVQVENKRKVLADAIGVTGAGLAAEVQAFFGESFGYRNRMDMIFHRSGNRSGIGFRLKGEWKKSVDVEECCISEKRLNGLIKEVRGFFFGGRVGAAADAGAIQGEGDFDSFDVVKKCGTFRYAVIRTPGAGAGQATAGVGQAGESGEDSSITFILNGDSTRLDAATKLIEAFARESSARNILVGYVAHDSDVSVTDDFFVVKGGENLKAGLLGREFEFSVQGFWQNNSAMAEKLHSYVRGLLSAYDDKSEWATLLDLYGGVGTFGINNADLFRKVKIVESFAPAIELARANLARNGIENAEAIVMDAKRLKSLELGVKGDDLYVITDPPRSGMHPNTILRLRELEPRVIIYISCNVSQLKSDLPKFVGHGYSVRSAAMFDLFPQTPHMESVVEMVRV